VLGVYAALVVVILWSPSAPLRPWPGAHRAAVVIVAAIGVLVAVGAAIVWTARAPKPKRRILLVGGVVGVIVVAVGGYRVQRGYLDPRYTTTGSVDAWARGVNHAHIGAVGYAAQYPLAGIDVSNSVEYIGWRVPHGGIQPARTCAEWRDVIGRSRYGYVVAGANKWAIEPADETAWTEADPHAQVVARSPSATVFRLTGPLDPKGCAAT
jgi:hypothetical protein